MLLSNVGKDSYKGNKGSYFALVEKPGLYVFPK